MYDILIRSSKEGMYYGMALSVRPSPIACERDILKTAFRIDFTYWYGLNTTKTSDAIDLGHSTKTKIATTAVWRLTLYPMQDIACEHDILKTACRIDFTFWCGLNTTKTSDAIDFGHSTKTKMAATAIWRLTLYPMQDIACERNILKTACQIDCTFWYGINTNKTLDAIDFGHSTKTKMAATAVWRLTLYPMQDIACERDSLKTACWIDFTFWYGLNTTKTSDANDFGHSTKTKMAATAVWRLTLYPMQDIACERDSLKTACWIDFTFWYGLNTTKTSDANDFGHSTKTKMAATAVWRLTLYPIQDIACECSSLKTACWIDFTFWYDLNTTIDLRYSTKTEMAATAVWRLTLYPMQDIACECGSLIHILIRPYFQVVNVIPCKLHLSGV